MGLQTSSETKYKCSLVDVIQLTFLKGITQLTQADEQECRIHEIERGEKNWCVAYWSDGVAEWPKQPFINNGGSHSRCETCANNQNRWGKNDDIAEMKNTHKKKTWWLEASRIHTPAKMGVRMEKNAHTSNAYGRTSMAANTERRVREKRAISQ